MEQGCGLYFYSIPQSLHVSSSVTVFMGALEWGNAGNCAGEYYLLLVNHSQNSKIVTSLGIRYGLILPVCTIEDSIQKGALALQCEGPQPLYMIEDSSHNEACIGVM